MPDIKLSKDSDQQYMEKLNLELTKEVEQFIKQYFDRQHKIWIVEMTSILEGQNDEQLESIIKHLKCVDATTIRQRNLDLQEACKLNVRRYRSMIQQNQEFFLSKWGNDEQRAKYTPIVLRRMFKDELIVQYHEGGVSVHKTLIPFPNKDQSVHATIIEKLYEEFLRFGISTAIDSPEVVYHDGDRFTFVPDQEVEVTYKDCMCLENADDQPLHSFEQVQNGICPNVETNVVKEHIPQLKHNIGSWNCNGCLVDGGRGSIQATVSEINSQAFRKATKWCPNFLAGGMGPMVAAHGVERWYNAVAGKLEKLCYAGIMHLQMEPRPLANAVMMSYKCDTCGLEVNELLQAKPEQDKELEVTDKDKDKDKDFKELEASEDEVPQSDSVIQAFEEKTNGQAT